MEWFKKNKWVSIIIFALLVIIIFLFIYFRGGNKERKFVTDTGDMILDYLKNYGSSFSVDITEYFYEKCSNGKSKCSDKEKSKVFFHRIGIHPDSTGQIKDEIKLSNLITSDVIHVDSYINPSNQLKCFDDDHMSDEVDPVITAYKDNDDHYYYYVDLSGDSLLCDISEKNGFVSNMPDDMIDVLLLKKVELPEELKNRKR